MGIGNAEGGMRNAEKKGGCEDEKVGEKQEWGMGRLGEGARGRPETGRWGDSGRRKWECGMQNAEKKR